MNVQLPSAGSASSDDSELTAFHEPVNGASEDVSAGEGPRRRVVEHDLADVVAEAAGPRNSVTVSPDGEVSVPTRSPTKVWSMPTVVAPSAVEQVAPSTENVSFDAVPTPVDRAA